MPWRLCRDVGLPWSACAMLALGLAACTPGAAPPPADHAHDLGRVDFPVSCAERVQPEFNSAVALLHHMTYPQARETFARVSAADPTCAMAHWGIAMTLFQPLWPTRPDAAALARGLEEVQRAAALGPPTERERMFVAAAEAFFGPPASLDYWQRINRWEGAMEAVYRAEPDDPEAAAFFALAHLATTPADRVTRDHADRAAEILQGVYEGNREHPGTMHYLIHANDVPGRERELLEVTRTYEKVAPRNPHALHMPTHIYTRLGDWDGVVRGNLRAAEAALEHPAGNERDLVWDEFPHAIEYLVYAYLQQGDDAAAAAAVSRLRGTAKLEPTFKTAFHLSSTAARDALERADWTEAAGLVPRERAGLDWDRFTWPEAVTWFARGLGAARLGQLEPARAAAARLVELETATRTAGEELFARNIRVLLLEVEAWVTHLEGRRPAGLALMQEAITLEASTPKHAVTPGPTLPAEELLGDLLMEQGSARDALAAYQRDLTSYPRRFRGLLGAARAARASGDTTMAAAFYQQLLDVAGDTGRREILDEAQRAVGGR